MRILLYGATGMVGTGVLRECLLDHEVKEILSVGRRTIPGSEAKLRQAALPDLTDLRSIADEFVKTDACFFCLGVTSSGMDEASYRKVTMDIPVAAARLLAERSPQAIFILVTGEGSDATSTTMWSRVKGETENAILAAPLRATFVFRPGFIRPMHGAKSQTRSYRWLYTALRPLIPLVGILAPRVSSTTEEIGRAMLSVARHGFSKRILTSPDFKEAAAKDAKPG